MEFIFENWLFIFLGIGILAGIIIAAIEFFNSSREEQLEKVKEWLLYATTYAEKEFGSGTGKIKLRSVYDMFVTKFQWLAKIISFDRFSDLVDEVLGDMNNLLATNEAVNNYVNGSSNN